MKGKLILGAGMVVLAVVIGVVLSGIVPAQATDALAPDEVVTRFYDWYLDYIGEGEMRRNPLVDRAYRSSELLSEEFIAEVDELLDSRELGGGDPFLQAQDVPGKVNVGEPVVSGETAQVRVETSFEGHALLVTLKLVDGEWKIAAIDRAPEMVVRDFYNWYLQYSDRDGEMRNPLVGGAYRQRPELSEAFVAEIDETLASFDKGGFDPILLAQDVPVEVAVGEATVAGDRASVNVQMFWGGNPTPSERVVTLNLVGGQWKIVGVALEAK